jgi:hypothetical protein
VFLNCELMKFWIFVNDDSQDEPDDSINILKGTF